MRKLIYIMMSLAILLPAYSHSKEVCTYKVKKGDWIAKILRDLGSQNPFNDKSYFTTVKLNDKILNVNKLSEGDLVIIPSFVLSEEAKSTLCTNQVAGSENETEKIKFKMKKKRVPASVKPIYKKEMSMLEKKNKRELSDFEPFPILEYKAELPNGGAK